MQAQCSMQAGMQQSVPRSELPCCLLLLKHHSQLMPQHQTKRPELKLCSIQHA
jgi:hypothetical protein